MFDHQEHRGEKIRDIFQKEIFAPLDAHMGLTYNQVSHQTNSMTFQKDCDRFLNYQNQTKSFDDSL